MNSCSQETARPANLPVFSRSNSCQASPAWLAVRGEFHQYDASIFNAADRTGGSHRRMPAGHTADDIGGFI
jgi:hypothetical protein